MLLPIFLKKLIVPPIPLPLAFSQALLFPLPLASSTLSVFSSASKILTAPSALHMSNLCFKSSWMYLAKMALSLLCHSLCSVYGIVDSSP